MALSFDDITINTLIGAGSAVSGDVKINGFVRVDGDIDGNLETGGNVIIGEKARIRGNVTASSIVVGGIIIGDIIAPKSVKLLSSSAVIGDVTTHRLEVEDKVVLHGHCIALSDDEAFTKAAQQYSDQKTIRSKVI